MAIMARFGGDAVEFFVRRNGGGEGFEAEKVESPESGLQLIAFIEPNGLLRAAAILSRKYPTYWRSYMNALQNRGVDDLEGVEGEIVEVRLGRERRAAGAKRQQSALYHIFT